MNVLGSKVLRSQTIILAPAASRQQETLATILLNKPIGYVSGQPEKGYLPAVSLITEATRAAEFPGPRFDRTHLKGLAPAGRLDIDSKGLLVFTQDGRLAKLLTGETSQVDKEYLVRVGGGLDDSGLAKLRDGLSLDGKRLRPAEVTWINADQLRFVLREGRKRQIRRMCEGQWRYLAADERF